MDYAKEKIKFLVSHAKQDINLCVAAFQLIGKANPEDRGALLECFISEYKEKRTDESFELPNVINNELLKKYVKRYQRIVDGHLEEFINAGLKKEEFYKELVTYIMEDKYLLDDGARAFAILDCCEDRRFPYEDVDLSLGMRMEDREFAECIDAVSNKIRRIKYIMNANIHQKTETASLLIKELDSCQDDKHRVVLLTAILGYYGAITAEVELKKMMLRVATEQPLEDL